MNKRVEWVDVGKYICIMFVMLSHLESRTEVLRIFYSPFFLSGFFFLSGYVYKHPSSFRDHIIKKLKQLLLPWFIFSNFNIFLSTIITFNDNHDWKKEVLWNLFQIRPLGDGLWFIAALFVAFIPFYFVINLNNRKIAISLSFVLSFLSYIYSMFMPKDLFPWGNESLPWHIEYIFKAMIWMVVGYYYKKHYEALSERYINNKFRILIPIVYILVIYSTTSINGKCISLLFTYIKFFLGISFILVISKRIKSNWYISFVGSNTFLFYAFHGKVYTVIQHILSNKMNSFYTFCLNNVVYSSILAILITILMSILLIVPVYCIDRWLPWTMGKKKKIGGK